MFAALLAAVAATALSAIAADEFDEVTEAANRLAANGKPVVMTADRLHALLSDADPSNDPFLASVCAPADFAKAHIKGSVNIPRGAFWKPANLAKLPPKDKPIVTYCYTGTGAVGPATVLNLMGYNAVQLEWGLMGWSKNDVALGPATRFPESQQDYPVAPAPRQPQMTYVKPSLATGKSSLAEILVARGDAVEAADKTVSMTAEAVQGLLADADPANDPYIIDIRNPADYARGHIKGAVNIPAAKVYQDCYLAMLPPTRRIVVADYNGQAAVGTSYVLSILGYNARGLQFGMMGWSKDDRLMGPYKRFPDGQQKDFPIVTAK
jgi:rhodanese-related sulfurtransferase